MPRKAGSKTNKKPTVGGKRRKSRARTQQGKGIKEFFGKINAFLKKTKIISKVANAAGGILPGAWGTAAGTAGTVAGSLGYGKRGRGIRLVQPRILIRT